MNSEHPLFSVSNHHVASCGEPPTINGDEPGYHSYFENEHGEQSLFVYDYDSESGTVWCGDAGWDRPYPVDSGDEIDTLPLTDIEQMWLKVCWHTATRNKEARAELRG